MSRRHVLGTIVLLALPHIAVAQNSGSIDIGKLIEESERAIALDEQGCPKYSDPDEIVVCGASKANRELRPFKGQGDADEDRIRKGEAVSTKRAAACIVNCWNWLPSTVSMGFGYVPPPAIPLEEVMKGLPDAENVVKEGSVDSGGLPVAADPKP